MIHDWGMGQKLYYEPSKDDAEKEINLLLSNAYQQALDILQKYREETQALAEQLLIEETFTREEVLELFGRS